MDTIVVGVGEEQSSAVAVQWAADEANRRGASMLLLRAVQYPGTTTDGLGGWYPADLLTAMDDVAEQQLQEARRAVLQRAPGLPVVTRLVHVHPRLALTEASETAGMVVTGSRRRGGLASALLGSTSMHVAEHSRCPVAVVRGPAAAAASGVVVGHDGSASADAALEFAAAEAAAVDEELLVVRAWPLAVVFPLGFDARGYAARLDKEEATQRRRLESVAILTRAAHPSLRVRTELLIDVRPSEGLVAAASSARLLVVGSRGHGAFASMLLGSTSHSVLQTAQMPVVVVSGHVRAVGSMPVERPAPASIDEPPVPHVVDTEPVPQPA